MQLLEAASSGDKAAVSRSLENGANVNTSDASGKTPLHLAVWRGYDVVVEFLVETANANVDLADIEGWTPLACAVDKENLNLVKYLVLNAKANVDLADIKGVNPLACAVDKGNLDIVECLVLKAKADVNKADIKGWTPLARAVYNDDFKMSECLVLKGKADVNRADIKGWTPLAHAAYRKNLVLVKFLAEEAKADIDKADDAGRTPLYLAVSAQSLEVVRFLMGARADVRKASKRGWTPLHNASCLGDIHIVMVIVEPGILIGQNIGAAKILNNRDLVTFMKGDEDGTTALQLAALYGHLDIVQYMIEHDASINQKDQYGRTALTNTARKDHKEVAIYLLNHGADIGMLEKEFSGKLLAMLHISPVLVNSEQFGAVVSAMSLVGILLATIAYVGWLNPPGGFSTGLSMLDEGAVNVCRSTGSGTLNGNDCFRYKYALPAFFILNSLAFFFSMGAVVAALIVSWPMTTHKFVVQADINRWNLRVIVAMLLVSIVCGLSAFTSAGIAVMPHRFHGTTVIVSAVSLAVIGTLNVYIIFVKSFRCFRKCVGLSRE